MTDDEINDEVSFCDVEDEVRRADTLGRVLKDVETATGGAIKISDLVAAQRTVDIGCGRGAYGLLMRRFGNVNRIVGIEVVPNYQDGDAYDTYTEIIFRDIRLTETIEKVQNNTPDCIIAIGVPPTVNRFIIENYYRFGLSQNGFIVLISDVEQRRNIAPFHEYNGSYVIDNYIFVYGR
jgi:hypothetical protein